MFSGTITKTGASDTMVVGNSVITVGMATGQSSPTSYTVNNSLDIADARCKSCKYKPKNREEKRKLDSFIAQMRKEKKYGK